MYYAILDSAGNALASHEDELTARAVLHAMVAVEPAAREHLAMIVYDERGIPVGDAIMAIDVPPAVFTLASSFLVQQVSSGLLREPARKQTRYVPLVTPTRVAAA